MSNYMIRLVVLFIYVIAFDDAKFIAIDSSKLTQTKQSQRHVGRSTSEVGSQTHDPVCINGYIEPLPLC